MRKLMNLILGMVELEVTAPFPERLINLCAQARIDFWAMDQLDEHTVRLTIRRYALDRFRALAERAGCEMVRRSSRGLPVLLGRFRTRYAFLAGLLFALCAVGFLSRFVLTVEVTGNEKIPAAVILSQVRQLGVRPGAYGPDLDCRHLAEELILKVDGLSWAAINLHGTRAEVIVREAVEVPERLDESGWSHVVAEADGIVTHIEPERGDAMVQDGDVVAKGDVLISGTVTMEPPLYSGLPERYYQTHARGRVWARTWRVLTAVIPLETTVKDYTGEEKSAWSLDIFGRRIKIFGSTSISWPMYDKMTTVHQASIPGRGPLPLSLEREDLREYRPRTVQVDQAAAQALLEEQLLKQLDVLIGEDGETESTQFSARVSGGRLEVTLTAQCLEEIGEERPGTEQIPEG